MTLTIYPLIELIGDSLICGVDIDIRNLVCKTHLVWSGPILARTIDEEGTFFTIILCDF